MKASVVSPTLATVVNPNLPAYRAKKGDKIVAE
jgi:hypothetical protein